MTAKQEKKIDHTEKHNPKQSAKGHELESRIQELETKLAEQEQITKRAQLDYITLKADFDRRQRVKQEEAKTAHIDTLIESVKKFLPFVEGLRKSLETLPEDQKDKPLAQGIQMTYNKFVQTLESMKIKTIDAIGQTPDGILHEPVSTQSVDAKDKGKIVAELERGFIYDDGQTNKVITTSKVIIGQ